MEKKCTSSARLPSCAEGLGLGLGPGLGPGLGSVLGVRVRCRGRHAGAEIAEIAELRTRW